MRDQVRLDCVDLVALAEATGTFDEFPCCDRHLIPRWTFGRVTLLRDAAYSMYPTGSNGARQAILDARSRARHLALGPQVRDASADYETERRPATTALVLASRWSGPERVIDLVEARAPAGFHDLEVVAPYAEREAIVRSYASLAGAERGSCLQGDSTLISALKGRSPLDRTGASFGENLSVDVRRCSLRAALTVVKTVVSRLSEPPRLSWRLWGAQARSYTFSLTMSRHAARG